MNEVNFEYIGSQDFVLQSEMCMLTCS